MTKVVGYNHLVMIVFCLPLSSLTLLSKDESKWSYLTHRSKDTFNFQQGL